MNNWLKRILPQWLQYLIYRLMWDPIRKTLWKALKLECTLRSGIRVAVISHPDWVIYNEVIVNGEYDAVIRETIDKASADSRLQVVDLGANVGYFSFRFADIYLHHAINDGERIDLLKCDIEGAEFDLIDNYGAVLRNVDAAVLEFHYYGRDVDRARAQLRALGFKPPEVLSAVAPCSVEFFRR